MGETNNSGLLYSNLQNQSTLTQIFLQLNWCLQSTFSIPSYKINKFLIKSSLNWTEVDRVTSTLCTSLCELYVSCVKLQVDLFFWGKPCFLIMTPTILDKCPTCTRKLLTKSLAKTIHNVIFQENLLQCKLWCTSGVKMLTASVCFVNFHTLLYFTSKQMCTFTLNEDDTTIFIKIKTFIKLQITTYGT